MRALRLAIPDYFLAFCLHFPNAILISEDLLEEFSASFLERVISNFSALFAKSLPSPFFSLSFFTVIYGLFLPFLLVSSPPLHKLPPPYAVKLDLFMSNFPALISGGLWFLQPLARFAGCQICCEAEEVQPPVKEIAEERAADCQIRSSASSSAHLFGVE